MQGIIFSIKDILTIINQRRENEFDSNLAVSGDRGNGKSTLIGKIFFRLPTFGIWKELVYNRKDIQDILKFNRKKQCWDDEAINSGYKRDFQQTGQKEQIKILTNYRDNLNFFASAIPNFFSLDKDLRDLYFIHLHVIERGIAVVHMPLQGRLYSQDRWDAKYNAKVEESWSKKMQSNPNFKPPYHRLTTFRGYLFYNDMTKKQKELYKRVKRTKRGDVFEADEGKIELSLIQKLYKSLIEKKLSKDGLMQICLMEGKKYSSVTSQLNIMLKDNGERPTMMDFLTQSSYKPIHNSSHDEINKLVPSLP